MQKSPLINITIPLYNEEKILAKSVENLILFLVESEFPYPYTVLLVNNASTDSSLAVCNTLASVYTQVEVLDLNEKGKGNAIKTAWSSSNADVLTFMDADMASDLQFFLPLVDSIVEDGSDLVIGNRLGSGSRIIGRQYHRALMSRMYNLFVKILFGSPFDDHQCGFKAMKRGAFTKISSNLKDRAWFLDTELIVISLKNGFRIKSIDIIWTDRKGSKVSLGKTSYDLLKSAISLRRRVNHL